MSGVDKASVARLNDLLHLSTVRRGLRSPMCGVLRGEYDVRHGTIIMYNTTVGYGAVEVHKVGTVVSMTCPLATQILD